MSDSWPKISIITPVKNSRDTIEKSIKSTLDQNYPNLEYIIVDGKSIDGTVQIIKKYLPQISCFISQKDRSGIAAQLHGIKKAQGEIIGIINADDFYEPQTLIKIAEEFTKDPSLDIVSCRFRTIRNDEIVEEVSAEEMRLDKNKIISAIGFNARFYRKSLIEKYGAQLSEDGLGRPFISNDLEYMIRILFKGIKEKTIDHIGYSYIMHDDSLTFSRSAANRIRLFEDRIYIAKKFLNSTEFDVPKIWQKTLKKWIKKYRSMLVSINLKEKNLTEAKKHFIAGIKENGIALFIFHLTKTLIRSRKQKEVGF